MKAFNTLILLFIVNLSLFGQDKTLVKPQIKVVVNDTLEDFKAGVRSSLLRTVKLRVVPDTFIVTEFKISMLRGNKVVGERTFYSNTMDLLHTLMAKPGDRLVIEAKHVMQASPGKTAAKDVSFEKHKEVIPIR